VAALFTFSLCSIAIAAYPAIKMIVIIVTIGYKNTEITSRESQCHNFKLLV
jgi:hypothetical protein